MRFYVISPVSNFIDNRRIKTFHADMFHGLAERDGKEFPHDTRVYANTESPSSLLISRTGCNVPDISLPGSDLVVSERYASRLEGLPHIRLMPVVFKRLVNVAYEKGDMTWTEKWGNVDPYVLLRTLPDVPRFHREMGKYYEVQAWRWRDVLEYYPTAENTRIEEGTPPMEKTDNIRLSAQMLEDYPILCFGDVIVSESVFQILDAGLDRDFFIIREYRVPGSQPARNG